MARIKMDSQGRNNISKQLKGIREKAGVSQDQLAARTSMTVATIVNIEKGHTNYGIDKVVKILEVLDASLTIPVE